MSPSPATRWRALCLISLVLALALTAAVLRWGALPGEAALRVALQAGASPRLVTIARALSDAGSWRGLVPATLLVLAVSSHARRRWWLWSGSLVLTPLIGELWQELVGRPRPHGSALGFPSGHAIAVATYSVLVCYLVGQVRLAALWRVGAASLVLGAMMAVGLARIILDAHWAADVVVGFALGAAGAAAAAWWDLAHPPRRRPSAPESPRVLPGFTLREGP